jgi:hypothetical protein
LIANHFEKPAANPARTEDKMSKEQSNIPPDPEDQNKDRAGWAADALGRFTRNAGEKPWRGITEQKRHELKEQNLSDLLDDFGHYCDYEGIDLHARLHAASYHYNEETENKGKQFAPAPNPLADASNLATILAALRLFQRTYENKEPGFIRADFPDRFEGIEPLGTDDINTLCEELNFAAGE